MRSVRAHGTIVALVSALALAGCGGEDAPEAQGGDTAAATSPEPSTEAPSSTLARRPTGEAGLRVPAARARIDAKESAFGRVLFDANGQVVYVFERDGDNRSACISAECVEAWPPVLTREEPTAGEGVDARLLGTIRRDDGRLQVTYNGRPLYFYEHEGPGEIKCHDVDLHGGLWWVVSPQGDPV